MLKTLAFMLCASLAAACAGSGSWQPEYAGAVTVRSPELVSIEPDVWVVADADEPVFYTNDRYWLYRDGGWYQSERYDRGWQPVTSAPERLRRIEQPYAFVRYRSTSQTARTEHDLERGRREQRDYRDFDDDAYPEPQPQAPVQPIEPPTPPPPYPPPPQQESPLPDEHHLDARSAMPTPADDLRGAQPPVRERGVADRMAPDGPPPPELRSEAPPAPGDQDEHDE